MIIKRLSKLLNKKIALILIGFLSAGAIFGISNNYVQEVNAAILATPEEVVAKKGSCNIIIKLETFGDKSKTFPFTIRPGGGTTYALIDEDGYGTLEGQYGDVYFSSIQNNGDFNLKDGESVHIKGLPILGGNFSQDYHIEYQNIEGYTFKDNAYIGFDNIMYSGTLPSVLVKGKTYTVTIRAYSDDYVNTINITDKPSRLYLGETYQLSTECLPQTAKNKKVTWKSSNPDVLKVDENGVLTPLKPTNVGINITATTTDGTKLSNKTGFAVEGVLLEPDNLSLDTGKTGTIKATAWISGKKNNKVQWASDNTAVATVDSNGKVTAVKPGTANITATLTSANRPESVSAKAKVTVNGANTVRVTGVTLNKSEMTIEEGTSQSLTATVAPSNASNKSISWKSNNTSVATVDSNGKVTAVKPGTATITVTTSDGSKTANAKINVTAKNISVTGVTLNKTSMSIKKGESQTLTATVNPSNATNKSVSWSSSNTNVATVSNGVVKAVGEGTATITVKTADGGKTATCTVTVPKEVINVTGVSLNKTNMSIKKGESQTLTATVAPSNATNKSVSWSSSNTNVATVSNGVVKAVGEGTATITVKTSDGGKTATCTVTVPKETVAVTGVTLNKTSATIKKGETQTLTATVNPSNATNKSVTWTSSNTNVATVSNGVVKAVNEGTATIAVKTADGSKTATCTITVPKETISVTGITLDKSNISIKKGASQTLAATVNPSNATNKSVSWTSSNTNVATVSNGVVKAVGEGTATITAKTADGGKTATCTVTVPKDDTVSVESVTLNKTETTIEEGRQQAQLAKVYPTNATNKRLIWKSDNTSVATVDDAVVTAIKPGTANITVTTEDGGKTASVKVNVIPKKIRVTGVSLDKTSTSINKGLSQTLTATVSPSDATDKTVTWSSSDTNIATVSNGVVKAVGEGTTTITATTADGYKTATCKVTVLKEIVAVTGVTLNKKSASITKGASQTLTATVSPSNAANKSVSWTSSNKKVATVSNGVVKAVGEGTATITVKTADGNKTATCTITVPKETIAVTGIALNKTNISIEKGSSQTLIATVSPSNATNKSVSWISSNTKVATVSNGVVKAVGEGTATITAKTADGGKTATCKVTVPKERSSEIDPSKYRFKDVTNEEDYFYKAVNWAGENGIASGTDGLFYPQGICTREQAITFIWRLCGKPSPKSLQSKYKDVKDVNRYSYKAIAWGTENGIITGTNGVFTPTGACTREQIVTMLWRLAGKPNPKSTQSGFSDVTDKNRYSYKAILWAHEKGITNSPNGTFYPYNKCLRQEIVTFLYRYSVYIK